MKLTDSENNMFANMIYEKPIVKPDYSLFKKIRRYIARKNYEATTINPMITKLRNTAPSFIVMCEMTDFVRILEKVFFYKNDIRKVNDDGPLETKLLSDTKMDDDKKILILELQKEQVTIKFVMTREYKASTEKYDDIIHVTVYYEFGKKLNIQFTIINTEIEFTSQHDYNLMYNINKILQESMANLFEKYYKLA